MSVVRRGSAVLVVTGAVLLGPVGAAWGQEQDPSSGQQAATPTATIEPDPVDSGSGCEPDPRICQVTVTSEGSAGPQLPRTGPSGALLATGAIGVALVLAGGGAMAAGRRRTA
ncbi:MAG: hypothetical protein H7323_04410 [Frankiales bacterium]|nr:hypothetical protein [Frankiales bacterium]